MDRGQFYNTNPDVRVGIINDMLKDSSLKEVAKKIGVPESSFSKEMTNGDYVYIKRDNQYYKFVRDPNSIILKQNFKHSDGIQFIEKNLDTLRAMVNDYKKTPKMLVLDERVYNRKTKHTNKSIKMNSEIYTDFVKFCEENYSYLTIQDLVAQSLLEFINKYSN